MQIPRRTLARAPNWESKTCKPKRSYKQEPAILGASGLRWAENWEFAAVTQRQGKSIIFEYKFSAFARRKLSTSEFFSALSPFETNTAIQCQHASNQPLLWSQRVTCMHQRKETKNIIVLCNSISLLAIRERLSQFHKNSCYIFG